MGGGKVGGLRSLSKSARGGAFGSGGRGGRGGGGKGKGGYWQDIHASAQADRQPRSKNLAKGGSRARGDVVDVVINTYTYTYTYTCAYAYPQYT